MFYSLWIRERLETFLFFLFLLFTVMFPSALEGQRLASKNTQALALFQEGLILANAEKISESLEKFRLAIKADSNFIQAHLRYMDALRGLGREEEAVETYGNKSRQHPTSALYHFLYGRTLSDLAAKRAEFKTALNADSAFYWAQFGIAGTYMLEQRYDEAVVALNKALELNPQMVEAMLLLGTVYMEKGMPYQARRELEAALPLDPDNAGLHLRLGQVYSQLERYESAEKEFIRAAELTPKEPLIYYYIGLVCEMGKHPDRALKAFEKFLEMAPDHEFAPAARQNIEKLKK
ncbi:MAG TPA: tetratricopeptide repeat protein [archaeon]|nr:tetratricopeptide repeat protein [archaeon]